MTYFRAVKIVYKSLKPYFCQKGNSFSMFFWNPSHASILAQLKCLSEFGENRSSIFLTSAAACPGQTFCKNTFLSSEGSNTDISTLTTNKTLNCHFYRSKQGHTTSSSPKPKSVRYYCASEWEQENCSCNCMHCLYLHVNATNHTASLTPLLSTSPLLIAFPSSLRLYHLKVCMKVAYNAEREINHAKAA